MADKPAPLQPIYRLRRNDKLGELPTGYALLNCGHRIEAADMPVPELTPEGWWGTRCAQCAKEQADADR